VTVLARRYRQALVRAEPIHWLIRAGFVARGITYGIIGALAIALAVGAGTDGTAPNQQGALTLIARAGPGRVAVIVICIGLLAYALWKLYQGVVGYGPEGGGGTDLTDRVGNVAGGVAYLVFFAVGVRVLIGSAGNSSSEPHQTAGGVLAWPGGPGIVGLAGAILAGVSLYQLYDAFTGGFLDDAKTRQMDRSERQVYSAFGRVGLSARALVFALIGYFLIRTAIEYDPGQAVGVDGALARVHHQPMGVFLVALVGVGLLIFAVFSLFEARYRRL
jgi:Domain of Unknown Function (DUF1206)